MTDSDDVIRKLAVEFPGALGRRMDSMVPVGYPEPHLCYNSHLPDGWLAIMRPLLSLIEESGSYVSQVKVKFGELRCYIEYSSSISMWVKIAINMAYEEARKNAHNVCYFCAVPAGVVCGQQGWTRVVCSSCYDGRANRL